MVAQALRSLILSDATIAANVGTQMFPIYAPQTATSPYMTFRRIATVRSDSHDGPTNMNESVFSVEIWADSGPDNTTAGYALCIRIADAARQRANGYAGTINVNGVNFVISKIEVDDQSDIPETPLDGTEKGEWNVTLTFRVWWIETT